jgi:hypothetical protein
LLREIFPHIHLQDDLIPDANLPLMRELLLQQHQERRGVLDSQSRARIDFHRSASKA